MTSLAIAVLGLALAAAPQDANRRADAERLAASGAHAEALKRFQALAAENPDDIEARLWIARLHARMDHPERALDVYRSITSTHPQNVAALVGAGRMLTELERFDEAADALARAEALAADDPAVLAASGALHGMAGRSTLGLAYYDRALALRPTDVEVRQAADRLRASRAHRVQLEYDFAGYQPFDEELQMGGLEVNARVTDTVRLFARGQSMRADDEYENRGGGGIEWRPTRHLTFAAGAFGGTDTAILPELDIFASLSLRHSPRVRWLLDVRYADYDVANVWIGGPGIGIRFGDAELTARVLPSRTQLAFADSFTTTSASIGIAGPLGDRATVSAEYRYGIDRLDWLTLDRVLLDDEAHTAAFHGTFDFTPFVTLGAGYEYREQPGDISIHRALARLILRF
jgi:tetratricopeptide (TPR) repeat protein